MTVSGGVSGGHLNPAITVAVASLGKFPWWKVPHYLAAQYLGSLTASLTVFLVYWDSLVWYEHQRGEYRSLPDTARIFTTVRLSSSGQSGLFSSVPGPSSLLPGRSPRPVHRHRPLPPLCLRHH